MENNEQNNFSNTDFHNDQPNDQPAEAMAEPVSEPVAEPVAETSPVCTPEPVPEAAPAPEQIESQYRGVGAGRKETTQIPSRGPKVSPYADSPYVIQHPVAEKPKRQRRERKSKTLRTRSGIGRKLVAAAVILAVVGGSCGITAGLVNRQWENRADNMEQNFNRQIENLQAQIDAASAANTGNSVSGSPVASDGSLTPSQVYARNVNSVVLISCEVMGSVYGQPTVGYSTGSGFILSENGYILTNAHVVEGATSVIVTTYGGQEYSAAVIGADATNDVAVLKVEAEGLPAVQVGSSKDLIVGDQVVAIGNPLGELTATMTVGYVSAKDRDVTTDGTTINMIQTDAAINSGNSGGPLFNMKGEVVGITSAKYSGASASGATIEGIGFAIPMDDVMKLTGDLMEFGYVKGAYMGVMISDMDPQLAAIAEVYGLPVGPIIQSTEEGGAAHRAGIRAGDIVLKLGSTEITTVSDLTRALRNYEPGETAVITVYRDGGPMEMRITFDEKTMDTSASVPQESVPGETEGYNNPFDGKD